MSMTTSGQKNSQDLRQIVDDSSQDMSDMQSKLAKLKGLTADDKTEQAMLRSRIDEQSQLIMILKQRADDCIIKAQTLDRINKELLEFRDNANSRLEAELRKFNILDGRFSDLASNHVEMIKFKDEYKRSNSQLREENSRLSDENARLFSKTLLEKDSEIAQMNKKFLCLQDEFNSIDSRFRQFQQDSRSKEETYRAEIKTLQDNYKADIKSFQSKLNDAEEHLKAANGKLQSSSDSHKLTNSDSQTRISQLTKEKDELLDLAVQRGKLVQKEQGENKALQKKIAEMEKNVRNMEEKFQRDASSVNANLQVRRLREDLSEAEMNYADMVKQFEAFKKHTNSMLQKEKELNEKLRHLAG